MWYESQVAEHFLFLETVTGALHLVRAGGLCLGHVQLVLERHLTPAAPAGAGSSAGMSGRSASQGPSSASEDIYTTDSDAISALLA